MAATAAAEHDDDVDLEELQLDYDDVCNEVVELQAELRATKLEAQQLQLRLQAVARKNPGSQPAGGSGVWLPPAAHAPAPAGPAAAPSAAAAPMSPEDQRAHELRPLVIWLAEHVALDQPPEILDVGFEVPIGGRTVHLQRVLQWPLSGAQGSKLRLSVPPEQQQSLVSLLACTKAQGNRPPHNALRAFAAVWDLVPGELTTAAHARTEPAVLLSHRGSMQGILIATWPTREALEAFHALHSTNGEAPRAGDRVEVEYEGEWYAGVLHSVDAAGKASVKCDVDEPGVLTIAPLHRVKRLADSAGTAAPQTSSTESPTSNTPPTNPDGVAAAAATGEQPSAVELLRRRLLSDSAISGDSGGGAAAATTGSGCSGSSQSGSTGGSGNLTGHRRSKSAM